MSRTMNREGWLYEKEALRRTYQLCHPSRVKVRAAMTPNMTHTALPVIRGGGSMRGERRGRVL